MGYNLYITRQEDWFDENSSQCISIEEWKSFVAENKEMRLDNYAEAITTAGEKIGTTSDGLSVWMKYSGNGINGNYAWFSYERGNIIVKNPDQEIITKMVEIASKLSAKVQGDDGEIYD